MNASRKAFYVGLSMLVSFSVIFIIIFLPIFNNQNGLDYLDSLYNSISKASANYIPTLEKERGNYESRSIAVTLSLKDEKQADQTAQLFTKSGVTAYSEGLQLNVTGDLALIIDGCLEDAGRLFHNQGNTLSEKYGYPERQVLYNWWDALKSMEKQLNKQKKFAEAKFVASVNKKGVECAYNYYGIEPQKITEKLGTVIFSLGFYVIYTIWYGFALLYLFQGAGLKLDH